MSATAPSEHASYKPRKVKVWHWLILFILGGLILSPPLFVVQPSEMAGVRRLGKIITPTPLPPGYYWKIPWLDNADSLQVSLTTFQVNDLPIYTIDNQWISVSIGISFTVPKSSVFKLLYQVGRSGNFDIDQNIRPVISESTMLVFSHHPAERLPHEREQVVDELQTQLNAALTRIFGLNIVDVQISHITYLSARAAMICQQLQQLNGAKNQADTAPKSPVPSPSVNN